MTRHLSVPVKSVCAFSILLSATALSGVPAFAANDDVIDGLPTARACAQLGFSTIDRDEEGGRTRSGGGGILRQLGTSLGLAAPESVAPPPSPSPTQTAKSVAPTGVLTDSIAAAEQGEAYFEPPVDTERYPDATSNPIKQVADEPVSTFSIDVDTAVLRQCPPLPQRRQPAAARRGAGRGADQLFRLRLRAADRRRDTPFAAHVDGRAVALGAGQGRSSTSACRATTSRRDEQPPLNLVFLIDVSGSMDEPEQAAAGPEGAERADRPAAARGHACRSPSMPAPPARCSSRPPATRSSRSAARSTRCGPAARPRAARAWRSPTRMAEQNFDDDAVNRVILMTDGDFNVGIADPEKLEDFVAEKRETGVYLSVYGFGRGNYNDVMMQTLSQTGNGTAAYIDTLDEARKLFRDDFSGSLFPIADDVKIQVEFNPARVAEYRLIGYETRLLNREDFNNDQVDAGEVGAGRLGDRALRDHAGRRAALGRSAALPEGQRPAPATPATSSPSSRSATSCRASDTSTLIERPIDRRRPSGDARRRAGGDPLGARRRRLRPDAPRRPVARRRLRLGRHRRRSPRAPRARTSSGSAPSSSSSSARPATAQSVNE